MIANNKNNQYYLRFPKHFFPKRIVEKYEEYLKVYPSPFKSLPELINHTIQKVSLPKLSMQLEEPQETGTQYPPIYKKGLNAQRFINRSFTVTFKHIEGFLNYVALMECIFDYHDFETEEEFLPELEVNILNQEQQQLYKISFQQILYKGFGEGLDFSYSDVRNRPSSFTVEFAYNNISFEFADKKIY